jgi:hypothetical protein
VDEKATTLSLADYERESMNTDVLERVRRLVALSASSNENESREAAVKACRLILEHKIELYLPGGSTVEDKINSAEPDSMWSQIGDLLGSIADAGDKKTNVHPFDPFTAPFRVVAKYARARGIEMKDRGGGRYAAYIDGELVAGGWNEVVRVVFSRIERGSARGSSR